MIWESITLFGSIEFVGALFVVLLLLRKPQIAKLLFVAVAITTLVTLSAKFYFAAPRPCLGCPSDSFPSGHSSTAFAVASVLYSFYPNPLWFAAAALVGYSRLVLNLHYPIDVAVGALVGIVSTFIAAHVLKMSGLRGKRRRKA